MKTEKEIKEKLEKLLNTGSKSKRQEDLLFMQINTLKWVLNLTK